MTSEPIPSGKNWGKRAPLGIVLILSGMFVALCGGSWVAAKYFVTSIGFVASAEVLMAGIVAALIAGFASLVLMFRLPLNALTIATVIALPVALTLLVVVVVRMQAMEDAQRDPEGAYSGIASFTASVEQIVVTDPYLRVRMDVDSNSRQWVSTGPAPDHQVCEGTVRAKQLQRISQALVTLAQMEPGALAAATADDGNAAKRLSWSFVQNPGVEGSFAIEGDTTFSPDQQQASKELAAVVHAMSMAAASQTSRIRCD
ncbi:MAG: hypothetical protein NXH97_18245 [Rhodobacteraceae bacterium]|nr:hypothetical protein [Paracoccaceae bacterium]